MAKAKINSILILQGWAMLWVIIGHAPLNSAGENPPLVQWLVDFAYSFHMPLFVFISGYLFHLTRISQNFAYKDIISDKLIRLGIPYLFFTFVTMVIKYVAPGAVTRKVSLSLTYLCEALINPSDGPLNELWFVMMLFCLFALYPLWQQGGIKGIIIATGCMLVYHIIPVFSPNILSASSFCRNAIYFSLGVLAARYRDKPLLSLKNIIAIAIVLAISALSDLLMPWHIKPFEQTKSLGLIVISAFLAHYADRFIPWLFLLWRNYTYQIYLMGLFFQIAIKILYKKGIIESYPLGFILCILLGLYAPVIISLIAKRINNKFINLCLGLRTK